MEKLQKFLESEGGKIAVIIFMLVTLLIVTEIAHAFHHDPQESGRAVLVGAFSSLMTALITKLGGKAPSP